MIKTEIVKINGTQFLHNYSDAGMKISREGVLYRDNVLFDDALDPVDSGRTYTETDIPVPVDDGEEH